VIQWTCCAGPLQQASGDPDQQDSDLRCSSRLAAAVRIQGGKLNISLQNISLILLTLSLVGCSKKESATQSSTNTAQPGTTFGDEMLLSGYSVDNRGEHTQIELRWKALRKPSADYLVFVHALDSSGAVKFQLDHPLKNSNGLGTISWKTDEASSDYFPAIPPPNTAVGAYTLRVGLYVPNPMKVLPVSRTTLPQPADGWKSQSVLIEGVQCK